MHPRVCVLVGVEATYRWAIMHPSAMRQDFFGPAMFQEMT